MSSDTSQSPLVRRDNLSLGSIHWTALPLAVKLGIGKQRGCGRAAQSAAPDHGLQGVLEADFHVQWIGAGKVEFDIAVPDDDLICQVDSVAVYDVGFISLDWGGGTIQGRRKREIPVGLQNQRSIIWSPPRWKKVVPYPLSRAQGIVATIKSSTILCQALITPYVSLGLSSVALSDSTSASGEGA